MACSRCPHSPLSWECCLQMAPSHQPCLGVASGEERHLPVATPLSWSTPYQAVTDECTLLQEQLSPSLGTALRLDFSLCPALLSSLDAHSAAPKGSS